MSPHSHPPSNLFLFSLHNITYTLKIRKQNYLAKFRKKPFLYKRIHKENIKHHTLHHYTKKSHTYNQKGTQTNSVQPLQLEKTHLYTSQLSPKLPSKSQKPPNAKAFSLKRQRVYRQTSKRFKQNVKEFSSKRKGVSDKTQGRFSILIFL